MDKQLCWKTSGNSAVPKVMLALTVAAGLVLLPGCGTTHEPNPGANVKLTPNPPVVLVAPFRIETGRWRVNRTGSDHKHFQRTIQLQFMKQVIEELKRCVPAERRWTDELPNEGWMVAGDFLAVEEGSRALRGAFGYGLGSTKFITRVYVYDLSQSKTRYIFSFNTGFPDDEDAEFINFGEQPGGLSANPMGMVGNTIQGLKLDGEQTATTIAKLICRYNSEATVHYELPKQRPAPPMQRRPKEMIDLK